MVATRPSARPLSPASRHPRRFRKCSVFPGSGLQRQCCRPRVQPPQPAAREACTPRAAPPMTTKSHQRCRPCRLSPVLEAEKQGNTNRPGIRPSAVAALADPNNRCSTATRGIGKFTVPGVSSVSTCVVVAADAQRARAEPRVQVAWDRSPCASRSASRARSSPNPARRAPPSQQSPHSASARQPPSQQSPHSASARQAPPSHRLPASATRLCRLLTRLRRLLDLNALHERPVLQKVRRRRQRTRMGVHLEPIEIGRARAVGVGCRDFELKNDVPLDPLRDELGHGPRHVHDGRKRRALPTARRSRNHRAHRGQQRHRGFFREEFLVRSQCCESLPLCPLW